ncbi:hypothetical protein PCANC_06748 [Puccinia coronata f. sp. avenae]|uniref:Uncharacterized protein n=1 Tax=Puccinia coronata f. sp. avenae TaxID=200324 RepID=A0A2N5VE21_9BASI|nr:hypothetical protein PCANC_15351 [Puccinia coronata f. sp. avenae]PLW48166.1 hypothetical protein PCANC_06748 [Puccinia coronata f. sp. avenae]
MLYLVYGCPRPAGPLLFFTELRDRDRDAYSEPTAIAGHAVGKCIAIHTDALDAGTSLNALAVYSLGLEGFHSWWNPTSDAEHCQPGS